MALATSQLESLLGADRPRFERRPESVDTLGEIAAELGERAGIVLEPWQRDGLDLLMSRRENGKWACYEYAELCSRRNGKTAMLLVRALAGFLLLDETPILWTAQEVKTSMRAWRDFRAMLWKLGTRLTDTIVDLGDGVLVDIRSSNGKEGFERVDTMQELRMVARSKDSGRGFDADFLVVDEAYDFTAVQQDALAPTQMARPNAQIAYASSPPLAGQSSEALFALRKRAESGRSPRLGWRDWGRPETADEVLARPPAELAEFLDDPAVWATCNPALNRGRVTVETVENMRESMTDAGFCREVLGMWPKQIGSADGWEVISKDAWLARGGATERPEGDVAFCLDASWPDAAYGAVAVAGRRELPDGSEEFSVQVLAHRPGTRWMVQFAKDLATRHPDALLVLDTKGPAGHLHDDLLDLDLELITPGVEDIAHGFGRFVAEVIGDEPRLRHYDQTELDTALAAAGTRSLSDARTWARKGSIDISPLTAATGALYGALERGAEPWGEWG